MAAPTFQYRLWQRGTEWHWQVMTELGSSRSASKPVLASGVEKNSRKARVAALRYCLENERNN